MQCTTIKMKSMKLLIVIIVFASYFGCCCSDNSTKCAMKESCSLCIRTPHCVWCEKTATNKRDLPVRCFDDGDVPLDLCPKEYIYKPVTLYNSDVIGTIGHNSVQVQPQHVSLSMRVGEEKRLTLLYQQAKDYPIDLYFLIDFSWSMVEHRDTLAKLANDLYKDMTKLSNNFHMGFGTFVDKPVKPYSYTSPRKLWEKCRTKDCERNYSFKHQMKLTNDSESFGSVLKKTPMSFNFDFPEGGFEALMQAMVCNEQIGWRKKARKLLIFLTDGHYHLAGDGKLGGIVEPNDEQCHLDNNGRYSYEFVQDYPSAYQIQRQAKKNSINIIFAVTKNLLKYYTWFESNIVGASVVELTSSSSNIIDIIRRKYEVITNAMSLSDNSGESVEIKYYSRCTGNQIRETRECTDLKGRPLIEFTVSIKVLECPKYESQWTQRLEIVPGSINESMSVDLNIHCQCPCERDENSEPKSKSCSSNGKMECGICLCDPGRYGKLCECDGNTAIDSIRESYLCKANPQYNDVCSNRGVCKCGKCECLQRKNPQELIYGTFCECDNFSCSRYGNLLCSGTEHGSCDCGDCKCKSGWSGRACECQETNTTCIAPGKEDVCSGNGRCECGICNCTMTENFRYSGQYCEDCPDCPAQRCNELQPCVECTIHKSGEFDESNCRLKCSEYEIEEVELIDVLEDEQNTQNKENMQICREPDSTGCTVVFKYRYKEDNINIEIIGQTYKECSKELNIIAITSGVIGSIVIAGIILLLIWKICTSIHDSREYEHFEKETKQANFDGGDNPLYKTPKTIIINPMFRRAR